MTAADKDVQSARTTLSRAPLAPAIRHPSADSPAPSSAVPPVRQCNDDPAVRRATSQTTRPDTVSRMHARGRGWLAIACAAALVPACQDEAFVETTDATDSTSTGGLTDIATVTSGNSDPGDSSSGHGPGSNSIGSECITLVDCADDPCHPATACDAGQCVRDDLPAGTLLKDQVDGDCVDLACDADGAVQQLPAPDDVPADDGVVCTLSACDGTTPVHTPQSESCYGGPPNTLDIGVCIAGTRTCNLQSGQWGPCEGDITPTTEDCDPLHADDDCDGKVDESGFSCECGDGTVSAGELCDDGNVSDADACTAECEAQEVLEIAHGGRHACARLTDGRIKCWGDGDTGALGLGDTVDRGDSPTEMGASLPDVPVDPVRTPRSLSAGYYHTCVVFTDDALKCWGRNDTGQLGLGDKQHRGDNPNELGNLLPPVNLGVGQFASAVSAGLGFTCAVLTNGSVKCWGDNPFGQLGLGDTIDRGDDPNELGNALPPVALGDTAIAVSAGPLHACALLSGGDVKCWGANFSGALGQGDTQNRGDNPGEMGQNLPPVDLDVPAIAVSAGSAHSCALLADGHVKCWGSNTYGQLGYGDTIARGDNIGEMGTMLPIVDLGPNQTAIAIDAGDGFNCALLASGGVKCWGRNHNGQLGLGSTLNFGDQQNEMGADLPLLDLGTEAAAWAVDVPASGTFIACASLVDRSVKCWGTGTHGSLGLGDTLHRGDQQNEMGDKLPRPRLFSSTW